MTARHDITKLPIPRVGIAILLAAITSAAHGQTPRRATIWDLKLGAPISAQPDPAAFQGFACGSNGGPPRARLAGWADFMRCPPEANGLREIYFEYDDENEFVARARDDDRDISRWAGTHELAFPVITSALFDARGALKGIRMVTDERSGHRDDITEADRHPRAEYYQLARFMASRFGIDPARDCVALPLAPGESEVGTLFVKQACQRDDPDHARKIILRAELFRKPGQSGTNPLLPTQLTQGQFTSGTRLEIFSLGP